MSVMGNKRTPLRRQSVVRFTPEKQTFLSIAADVRFVPIAADTVTIFARQVAFGTIGLNPQSPS